MKGGGGLMDVEQSISVILPIASGVEERYLEGWNRFGAANTVPAVAAAIGAFRLHNPSTSQTVAVIEKALYATIITDQPLILQSNGASAADFGTVVTSVRLDARTINASSATSCTIGSAATTTGQVIAIAAVPANSSYDWINTIDAELTILPGDAVTIWGRVLNQAFFGSYVWRERALEASELT